MNTRVVLVCVLLALTASASFAADTEVAAKADTEVAAAATAAAAATTEVAKADTAAVAEADKPKKDDKKAAAKPAGKPFKPQMIGERSRILDVSQRADVRYTDGGLAKIINFGPRRRAVDNRVEADVGSRFFRRWANWANGVQAKEQPPKQKYITPRYADERPSRREIRNNRYVSYVPNGAFWAPRIPTHFEPEYADEHHFWSAVENGQFPFYGAFDGVSPVPRPAKYQPVEYENEYAARQFPFPNWFAGAPVPYDSNEWASHPNRRVVPAADRFGLPQFPSMPASAARHIAKAEAKKAASTFSFAPFSGLDDPTGSITVDSFESAPLYPSGAGARASLAKLDFALNRLQTLNSQLRAAEAKVAATKANIAESNRRIAALGRIKANLQKLATQIADLEGKVGRDPEVQQLVAAVTAGNTQVTGGVPALGASEAGIIAWLGDNIRMNWRNQA